jgi:TRAP-type C4-dicarboxylate transport system permease small subunit
MKNRLKKFEEWLLMGLLVIMAIVVALQVVFRYILKTPLVWSEELARFLQIWLAFLGIGYGLRNEAHVSMSLVMNKMPEKLKNITFIFSNLLIIFCFIAILPGALNYIIAQHQISSSGMGIRMSVIYGVVPVGGFTYIFYIAPKIIASIKYLYNRRKEGVKC